MDFTFTPSELAFREELRTFLLAHAPPSLDESFSSQLEWQRTLNRHHWVAPHWPVEFGGRGCTITEFALYVEEMGRHQVPQIAGRVGVNMIGSTILAHGRPEQKERYLSRMLSGEIIWCQMLSEPDAGSDLRSISTKARRDGDHWVVSGQKVWSSTAAEAQLGLLFVRLEDSEGLRGTACLICDMSAPGVEVRPLRQLTGDSEFCEVFLTDVRIPIDDVIGPVGRGWQVLQTTLSNERGLAYPMKEQIVLSQYLERTLERARKQGLGASHHEVRDQLVQCVIRDRIFRLLNLRTLSKLADGEELGPEASLTKLFFANHAQRLHETAMALKGVRAIAGDADDWTPILWYRQSSIAGGTSEIQRNILGESALGLPREPPTTR
jgi:alkylation response protein AidB-like acyl-CoA dehydrogenase